MNDKSTLEAEEVEFDWEENERELDEALKEIDYWGKQLEEGGEWIDLLLSMEGTLLRFKENMESLSIAFPALDSSEEKNNQFLCGVMMVGIVSAYESVVHDLFSIILNKSSHSELAVSQIQNLSKKDKYHLKLKSCKTDEELRAALSRATLHDPNQIARLSMVLFNVPLPSLPESFCAKLLRIRNDYSHNGGYDGGKKHKLSPTVVLEMFRFIMDLVSTYNDAVLQHADAFFTKDDDAESS